MSDSFANLDFALPPVPRRDEQPIVTESILGPFGITAEVPSFAEVIEWQEKKKGLDQGYYRLIHPPRVEALRRRIEAHYPGWSAVLFSTPELALKEWAEFQHLSGESTLEVDVGESDWCSSDLLRAVGARKQGDAGLKLHAALPDEVPDATEVLIGHLRDPGIGIEAGVVLIQDVDTAAVYYERNRRRGGVLSGRNVAWFTGEDRGQPLVSEADQKLLAARLKTLEGANSIFFYPSGMQAVTVCLDLIRSEGRGHVVVLGHVYRDTHILLEEMPWAGQPVSVSFLGVDALVELQQLLETRDDIAGVYIETVTNPHIEAPDLPAIAKWTKKAGVPLVVDSTMATPTNCRPLDFGADLVIHSTTKYMSGSNQHGGGIVLATDPVWADRLEADQTLWRNTLSPLETDGLKEGLKTYDARMKRFEANGQKVRAFLVSDPAVDAVYPVSAECPPHLTGWGSVVSCTLKDSSQDALARFFDAPLTGIRKAPSLGSDQTLFCPYVLLTYFDKDDAYLATYQLPRHLIRIAVGCEENLDEVLEALNQALRLSEG